MDNRDDLKRDSLIDKQMREDIEFCNLKEKPFKSKEYLAYFHNQGHICLVCGSHNIEAHHIMSGNRGRADDKIVPLCSDHHRGRVSPHGADAKQFREAFTEEFLLKYAKELYENYLMEKKMKLWIPIKPMPAPRPRVTKNGTYNNPHYTNYKKAIALIAKSKFKSPSDKPIYMKIDFFFEIPKSWSKKKRDEAKWHVSRPDADNLTKSIKDALNGIAYIDDAQVCFLHVRKQYATENGILIEIEEL